jgi:predicted metalloprotease with PDZ domain
MRLPRLVSLTLFATLLSAQQPIRLHVDATDAPRRVLHAGMTIPAKPGPITLLYPQWIPGDHSPDGPINGLVGLEVSANGASVAWKRDSVNMFAFHIDVPAGVGALDVRFDFLPAPDSAGGAFSSGASVTTELAVVNWNEVLLYPQGADADRLPVEASLRLPAGWKFATALPIRQESGGELEFQPAPLTTLIDSPVSAGLHYRTVDLGTDGGIAHYLHIAADSDRALAIPPETAAAYKNLVAEAGELFGAHHYRDYHFLLSLSDHIAHFGLEHHESSDDRTSERCLIDEASRAWVAPLLPHEFMHSWNGKYRRPSGLVTDSHDGGYDSPMKGNLLWVYEGLTEYLGTILTARSKLWTPDQLREYLALTAAALDNEYGRRWRPLEDTAVAAQILYTAGDDYADYRRNADFYPEGILIWLEADTLIRRESKGQRSLDDFCRAFYGSAPGAPSGVPAMRPYTFDDLVTALNAIQPYDWAAFFRERLQSTSPHAPLGGLEASGWKITYNDKRSDLWKAGEETRKLIDLSFSIGLKVKEEDGSVADVTYGGPAQKAGIPPSVKIIAVNNRQFSGSVLREAVKNSATHPVELLIKTGEYFETHRIDYHGGERYPHLEREAGQPDWLTAIIGPRAK